ncbi:MAG: alpha-galactosidase [Flavobacteriaceae bacterium]|nr:MAG: alpha-galactosidase [Flavobacteriaceae bacterium]
MKNILFIILISLSYSCSKSTAETNITKPKTPLMGWASWNNYHININEDIIKKQADFMVSSGMKEAGYTFINIDDGFFGGRDSLGNLIAHPTRFPSGMRNLSDYIHSKGLKAGIYSDAGINTCGSYWDKDTISMGSGMYGHERMDIFKMLDTWNYDFLKIDWCGGQWLDLDEQTHYTKIGKLITEIKPGTLYNICRWEFPGKWAIPIADSWRISGDISNKFKSILHIIDLNAHLWMHSSPGHVNDMDMLQVGRGMTLDEDKAHFSMWCMLNSPLLAGNDLSSMSQQTIDILTNKKIIALNQDILGYQARRLIKTDSVEVWAKPLVHTMSGKIAVTLLNRSDTSATFTFDVKKVGLKAEMGYTMEDLWSNKNYEIQTDKALTFTVPSHGVVVLKITGTSENFNPFQH